MRDVVLKLQIPADHPSFAGHFPGNPIVPGVVLLDEVMLAAVRHMPGWDHAVHTGITLPVCKFLLPVPPGATLDLTLSPAGQAGALNFQLEQAGQTVARGSLRLSASA
jgi:3-hydroxymyristoyl/3-hydroxydecanoyl-(acyl carrier protein) dehydratase